MSTASTHSTRRDPPSPDGAPSPKRARLTTPQPSTFDQVDPVLPTTKDIMAWVALLEGDAALLDKVESVTIGPSERTRQRGKAKEVQPDPDREATFPGLRELWPKLPKLAAVSISSYPGALVALVGVMNLSIELDTVTSLSLADCWPDKVNPYDKPLLAELVEAMPCLTQLSIDYGLAEAEDPPPYHAVRLEWDQLSRLRLMNWHPSKTSHVAKITKMLPTLETLVLHEAPGLIYPAVFPYLKCVWITGLGWTGGNHLDPTAHHLHQLDLLKLKALTDFDFSNGRCKKQFVFRLPPSLKELLIGEHVDCPVPALLELVQPGPKKLPSLEWIHHNQFDGHQGTYFRPKTDEELGTDHFNFNADGYSPRTDQAYDPAEARPVELATDWIIPKWTAQVPEAAFAALVAAAQKHGVGVIGTSADALAVSAAWRAQGGEAATAAEQDSGLFEEFLAPIDADDEADLAQLPQEAADLAKDTASIRPCSIERDTLSWADTRLIGAFGTLFKDRARFYEVEKALHWTPSEARNYDELPRYGVGNRVLWGWDLHKQVVGRKPFFK